jgi:hypothetical protein
VEQYGRAGEADRVRRSRHPGPEGQPKEQSVATFVNARFTVSRSWSSSGSTNNLAIPCRESGVQQPVDRPVRVDGHDAILVTPYLFTEGSRGGQDEELIYYRTLPDP